MRNDNYDEIERNKPIFSYFFILLLICSVGFLILSNFHLSQQVNDLQQQISMLSSDNTTTVSTNYTSDDYVTKEDVAVIRKQIGNLQDSTYDMSLKISNIEDSLEDISEYIGLTAAQQEKRNEIINQLKNAN